MDPKITSYGQGGLSPVQPSPTDKKATAKQLMEPTRGLPELTATLPARDLARLAKLAAHSVALDEKLQNVDEFGIANPINALWTLTAEHGVELPPGGDLAVAKALLPQVAEFVKRQI